MKIDDHPKFIINKLKNIQEEQFGYSAFDLKETTNLKKYLTKDLEKIY